MLRELPRIHQALRPSTVRLPTTRQGARETSYDSAQPQARLRPSKGWLSKIGEHVAVPETPRSTQSPALAQAEEIGGEEAIKDGAQIAECSDIGERSDDKGVVE